MKPTRLKFDLDLRTTPQAAPLVHHDWLIVRCGAGPIDRVIVQGMTDDEGKLKLTDMQELRLSVAAARWPGALQLIAPGFERPLDLYSQHPDWTAEQKNMHALAALDHADLPVFHAATAEGRQERIRAGEASGTLASSDFFAKLE